LLFGSQARGEADAGSDCDILVISEGSVDIRGKFALRARIRKQLLEGGIRYDVLIQSEQKIQTKGELPGHIVRSVLREGVPL
jgi:predicted nucleotidyltransferase